MCYQGELVPVVRYESMLLDNEASQLIVCGCVTPSPTVYLCPQADWTLHSQFFFIMLTTNASHRRPKTS